MNLVTNPGQAFMANAKTSFSRFQALPEEEKHGLPFLFFMDEANSYSYVVKSMIQPLFDQVRSTKSILCLSCQSVSSLPVVEDSWIKVFFKNKTAAGEAVITIGGDRLHHVQIPIGAPMPADELAQASKPLQPSTWRKS